MNSRAGSGHFDQVNEHVKGLKIHAMISPDLVLDLNDGERLMVPLCEVSFPKCTYLLVIASHYNLLLMGLHIFLSTSLLILLMSTN